MAPKIQTARGENIMDFLTIKAFKQQRLQSRK